MHIKTKCLVKLCCDTFHPKSLALRHYNALGVGIKCFNREVYAITFIRTQRCNLNVKTRAFLKRIPFRTISRFQNRVSYDLRKGASKSACFCQKCRFLSEVSGRSGIGLLLSGQVSCVKARCRPPLQRPLPCFYPRDLA